MRVISLKRLREFWEIHADAELPLRLWYKTALKASWSSIAEVRKTYPHADAIELHCGLFVTVFNIRGNHYRLVCAIDYEYFHVYVKLQMTHRNTTLMEGEIMQRIVRTKKRALPTGFEELVRMHPPRPIHDEVGYENAQVIIDALTSLSKRSKGQAEYLETLAILFSAYEQEAHAIDTSDLTPIAVLKHLMEEQNLSASNLGRLLGERSLGVKILNQQRDLSKKHIRKLAQHFGVRADLFL